MKLAFYRAAKGTVWSKAIALWTRGPYSHVEIVFDDLDWSKWRRPPVLIDLREHDAGGTLCFSSAENDGGTRFKMLDLHDGKWDLFPFPVDAARALQWCAGHQHLAYDWRGLRGFVFPWEKPDPRDLFCSECAVECGQDQGIFRALIAGRTSPNALAKFG